ncbi:MAG: RnfABCDGE type electron transport complex subunit D [Labilibaculum sp.]|nr:RnfABCDGE type electron transport complex subunit D [Labilibaculum sp.]
MSELHSPFLSRRLSVSSVMFDVVIALVPLAVIACLAFGINSLIILGVAIVSCLLSEILFSAILLRQTNTWKDSSAIVTGILLALTLSPLTPWYIVAFGGVTAILFGKVLWGGLGRNTFNPALVGRELMTVFFANTMNGTGIWSTAKHVNLQPTSFFPNVAESAGSYLNKLIYSPQGALGEYSILFIVLGGLYLIFRNRISWHIPLAMFFVFTQVQWLIPDSIPFQFALAGLLFGVLFMATDMPTSPSHNSAKIYYGVLLALVVAILIIGEVRYAYMSYGILIMNAFSRPITNLFTPRPWGKPSEWKSMVKPVFILTLSVLGTAFAVVSLARLELINYLVYTYLIFIVFEYYYRFQYEVCSFITSKKNDEED